MSVQSSERIAPPALYDVISSVGNHEVKALVLASMQPEIAYTITPIYQRIMDMQGDRPAWTLHRNTPHEYCATFSNVGLVAVEAVGANAAKGYKITQRGEKIAKPLVGHLLDLSLESDVPLLGYFGPTQTNSEKGLRSSQRRIELMRLMINRGGKAIPSSKLGEELGVQIHHASQIAEDLAANNLVNKASSGRGKPTISFLATPDLGGVEFRQDISSQILFDITTILKTHFSRHPDKAITNADIAKELLASGEYDEPLTGLIKKVSRKTNYLAHSKKVLRPNRDIDGTNVREAVSATDEQIDGMRKVVKIVEGIQTPSDNYFEEGRHKLHAITSDPDLVNELVAKGRMASIGVKGTDDERQKTRNQISRLLSSDQSPLSIREIQSQLLGHGNNIDRVTVYSHVKTLLKLGKLAALNTPEGKKLVGI